MARGKHSSAALARRYAAAEQDVRDWKRHAGEQKREIALLKSEVNEMPALKERVKTLEMQLDLATCSEIADLQKMVARQRESLRESERRIDFCRRLFIRWLRRHRDDKFYVDEYRDLAAALGWSIAELLNCANHGIAANDQQIPPGAGGIDALLPDDIREIAAPNTTKRLPLREDA